MPSHYRSPYGYSYFNPTGKEQAALTIGSLLSGVLAASSGQSKGDAIRKGIAGTMAGYGSGYQNYQELMGDAFGRDLQTKGYGQRIKEYEETEKPYTESLVRNRDFDNQMAFDEMISKKKNARYDKRKQQMEMALLKNKVVASRPGMQEEKPPKMPDVGNYMKLKAQLAALKSPQNMDYLGMPANERANTIADLENAIRVMGQHQPELIPPQSNQQIPQQGDVIARHQNDSEMQGTKLGKLTPQGYEVYKNGKLVGHYQ